MNSGKLTVREKQVLLMVCMEKTAGQIAEALHISASTVYTLRRHLLLKTGSRNKIGLVKYALRNNII
jgi:DNA-binding CsgD family transcriptional regulator